MSTRGIQLGVAGRSWGGQDPSRTAPRGACSAFRVHFLRVECHDRFCVQSDARREGDRLSGRSYSPVVRTCRGTEDACRVSGPPVQLARSTVANCLQCVATAGERQTG